jgi:hypothetical protein
MKSPGCFSILAIFAFLFTSDPAIAYLDNFEFTSPPNVYPPGCAVFTVPMVNFHAHAKTEEIFSGTVPLWDIGQNAQLDVEVQVKRIGCTEPDRSIIVVFFTVPRNEDEIYNLIPVPIVTGWIDELDGWYPLRLAREPHSYLSMNEVLREGESTTAFYLEGAGIEWVGWCWDCWMGPTQYNSEFQLQFDDMADGFGGETFAVLIPAYENQLQENFLPLNARLSGIWITPDASDQGFQISISEIQSSHAGPLVMFLSWNTFDKEGNPLWLTGSSSFPISSTEVTTDLILVENGQFLGAKTADRSTVGSIRLQAHSCTRIQAYYDLESVGLGIGEFTLTRLYNLEPAGFTCQDGEARQHVE